MAWTVTNPATGRSVTFADRALEGVGFDEWAATLGPRVPWSPTGPQIPVPPQVEVQAYALALMFVGGDPEVEGDPPDVRRLWLAPGEDDTDRVY